MPSRLPRLRRPRRSSLFVALLAAASPAFAQDDPRHDGVTDLSTVIVRANPIPKTAEDLTRPVAVLAGERLDAAKANSLGETVSRLPGVQASYFGPGVGRPIIRGLDGARVQVLSDGLSSGDVSTVSVDHAVTIEPFLANQIEVLKGPATLLYGSGAIGGAVNVIDGRIPEAVTTQPMEGRAELRAGSVNGERTGMLRMDGTSASGNVVFHFDALHRATGDYDIPGFAESAFQRAHQHGGDDHDHDGADDHAGEAKANGTLPNSFVRTDSAALGVSWIGSRGLIGVGSSLFNTRYGVPGHAHDEEDHGHDGDDHGQDGDGDDHGHDGDGGHGEEAPVHIVMDQRRNEIRGGLDDLGPFQSLRVKVAQTDYTHTEFEGNEVGTVFDNETVEGRAELVHRAWAGWQGVFGMQGSRRDFSAVGAEAFVPDSLSRDGGVFWIGDRSFGALDVELGARYDRNRVDVDAALAIGGSRSFDAASASASARWNIGQSLHFTFGLDRAQRTPTAEELYSNGLHVATQSFEFGDPDLDVETANRAEIGMHWHRGPLRVGASLYQLRFDDFVYLAETGSSDGGTPARVWTQADARFTGGELEVEWTFLDNDSGAWSMQAFGDVVRGELAGSGSREVAFAVPHGDHVHRYTADIALSGNLPRMVPARVGGELRWQGRQWRAAIGAVHYDQQVDVGAFERPSDSYTLMHAGLAWHVDTAGGNGLELFVDGSNLLDEEARPHTSPLRELAPLPGRGVAAGVRVFF